VNSVDLARLDSLERRRLCTTTEFMYIYEYYNGILPGVQIEYRLFSGLADYKKITK
jgi:hypothetical protein